jgi:phosphoribosylaminoimidazolecarboxamide formyltransferase / IMP cyclohydrolase
MQNERYAFLSTYDKTNLGELSQAADEAGYRIVSLGGTAKEIENEHGIPVIHTEEFVHEDDKFTIDKELEEREQREIVAGFLAQHMCKSEEKLRGVGRRPIDLVCINLLPPEISSETGGYKSDKGGVLMLSAALEGNRTVLTAPIQIPIYATYLNSNPSEEADKIRRLLLADEAFS